MLLVAFLCFALMFIAWLIAPGISADASAETIGPALLPELPPAGARA